MKEKLLQELQELYEELDVVPEDESIVERMKRLKNKLSVFKQIESLQNGKVKVKKEGVPEPEEGESEGAGVLLTISKMRSGTDTKTIQKIKDESIKETTATGS